jgi:TolA-binding protein
LLLVLCAAACSGALAEGKSQFEQGRYAAAKQTFASAEGASRGYGDRDRAAYALYRGLTLGALGDRAQAGVWLREARAIEDAHPGALTPDDARRLKEGLETNEAW